MDRIVRNNEQNSGINDISSSFKSISEDKGIKKLKVGDIMQSATVPGPGWLPCDGKSYNRALHPELANIRQAPGIEMTLYPTGFHVGYYNQNLISTSQATIMVDSENWSATSGKYAKRTTDNGNTWQTIVPFPVTDRRYGSLFFAKNNDGSVLAAVFQSWSGNYNDLHFSVSHDHGITWEEKSTVANFGEFTTSSFIWDGKYFRLFSWATNKYIQSTDLINWSQYTLSTNAQPISGGSGVFPVREQGWNGWVGLLTPYSEGTIWELGEVPGDLYQYGKTPNRTIIDGSSVNYSYDHQSMYVRLSGTSLILYTDDGTSYNLMHVPSNIHVASKGSTVELGMNKELIITPDHPTETVNYLIYKSVDNIFELIFLDTPLKFLAGVTQHDGSVLFQCAHNNTYKTLHIKHTNTLFKVPGIPKSAYDVSSYIYAGGLV